MSIAYTTSTSFPPVQATAARLRVSTSKSDSGDSLGEGSLARYVSRET
jgi:hypothetical protein